MNATPRQLYILSLLMKKDCRSLQISKADADKIIRELVKPVKVSLEQKIYDQLATHIEKNFDKIFETASKALSKVTPAYCKCGNEAECFPFVGYGCGITYLTYRRNNKKAAAISAAASRIHRGYAQNMFLEKFSSAMRDAYSKAGLPLEALWQQDIIMQQSYYNSVLEFAEKLGVKMELHSRLD